MKKQPSPRPLGLDCLPLIDPETGDITVVVETPKDSHNKYKFDPQCAAIRLTAVLGEGLSFPYDFGFFPSTLGDDGDPLDALLFLDHAVPPGCVASVRLLGVLEAQQRKKDRPWTRNDRFLAVATHAHTHGRIRRLADLRPHLLDEIESFFVHYDSLNGKQLQFLDRRGPNHALKLLKAGQKAFKNRRKKKS
jgi:inorganic pyrophosphatase